MGPAQVREGLVLDGDQQVTELLRQQRPRICFTYLFLFIYLFSTPDCPDVLLPVPGVDGDEGLDVPDCVELGGDDVRRQGQEIALVQTYPTVIGLQERVRNAGDAGGAGDAGDEGDAGYHYQVMLMMLMMLVMLVMLGMLEMQEKLQILLLLVMQATLVMQVIQVMLVMQVTQKMLVVQMTQVMLAMLVVQVMYCK